MRFSISTIFLCCLKDSTWAPYEQVKTVCELFGFAKIFDCKARKLCIRVVNNYADKQIFL